MKKIMVTFLSSFILSSAAFAEQPATYIADDNITNVHNRCIVRFYDDLDGIHVTGLARALAAQASASIKHVYKHSIKGFTINMPCSAAKAAFGSNSYITSMSPDGIVSINKGNPFKDPVTDPVTAPPQEESYGTFRVGGPIDGSGYTAWIIDTGIDIGHEDLNVDDARGFSVIFSKGIANMNDEHGHGTHVAGTIGAINNTIGALGVAPNTTVIPVRVLDRRGSGSISGVIAGVDHVAENAGSGDCVNMSLGGGISNVLDDAVKNAALTSGTFFALAAGNSGDDANNHSPARANGPNVWTISAINENDIMPSWSNYGSPVDYAAPGVGIFSLWKNGGTNTISGTSMATPHACAVLMMSAGNPSSSGFAGGDPDGDPDSIIHF